MTWADYITWYQNSEHLASAVMLNITVFISYHIGRYVGRKERK